MARGFHLIPELSPSPGPKISPPFCADSGPDLAPRPLPHSVGSSSDFETLPCGVYHPGLFWVFFTIRVSGKFFRLWKLCLCPLSFSCSLSLGSQEGHTSRKDSGHSRKNSMETYRSLAGGPSHVGSSCRTLVHGQGNGTGGGEERLDPLLGACLHGLQLLPCPTPPCPQSYPTLWPLPGL